MKHPSLLLVLLTGALVATACGRRNDATTESRDMETEPVTTVADAPAADETTVTTTTISTAAAAAPTPTAAPALDTESIDDAGEALDAVDALLSQLGNQLNGIAADLAADASAQASSD